MLVLHTQNTLSAQSTGTSSHAVSCLLDDKVYIILSLTLLQTLQLIYNTIFQSIISHDSVEKYCFFLAGTVKPHCISSNNICEVSLARKCYFYH